MLSHSVFSFMALCAPVTALMSAANNKGSLPRRDSSLPRRDSKLSDIGGLPPMLTLVAAIEPLVSDLFCLKCGTGTVQTDSSESEFEHPSSDDGRPAQDESGGEAERKSNEEKEDEQRKSLYTKSGFVRQVSARSSQISERLRNKIIGFRDGKIIGGGQAQGTKTNFLGSDFNAADFIQEEVQKLTSSVYLEIVDLGVVPSLHEEHTVKTFINLFRKIVHSKSTFH